jgi:predicted unusual protein kinase regulating ubiquinone biosynthesis (AarF/ABC1/UbiB family)
MSQDFGAFGSDYQCDSYYQLVMVDEIDAFRRRILSSEGKGTPAGFSRLWRTGKSAMGMASAVLGGQFRGRGRGLEAADFEAVMRLVERLGQLKGVAMKAGQILGYVDPSLSPELRGMLSVLQTASPPSPLAEVEGTIRDAFGDRAEELLATLERSPIAVASIGQVHRATLRDGQEVAVKVRHAGIEAALASDFKAASLGSAIATSLFGVAGGSVKSFVDEARSAILEECDYQREATRQAEFARIFEGDPEIVIPPVVLDWCGPGVLTTGWRPGQGLDGWLGANPDATTRNRVGEALFRVYVGTLYRHGLFHADPHPGNYGFRDDGRIVVYDFGCVRQFEANTVRAFAALVSAVRVDDHGAMSDALSALGANPRPNVNSHLRKLLRGFFGPLLAPGVQRIKPDEGLDARQVMQDKRATMQLALPGKLLFLFRLRFGLYAVLSRIEAEADWSSLESKWADDVLAHGSQRVS